MFRKNSQLQRSLGIFDQRGPAVVTAEVNYCRTKYVHKPRSNVVLNFDDLTVKEELVAWCAKSAVVLDRHPMVPSDARSRGNERDIDLRKGIAGDFRIDPVLNERVLRPRSNASDHPLLQSLHGQLFLHSSTPQ